MPTCAAGNHMSVDKTGFCHNCGRKVEYVKEETKNR
jgi:hypothetical protein